MNWFKIAAFLAWGVAGDQTGPAEIDTTASDIVQEESTVSGPLSKVTTAAFLATTPLIINDSVVETTIGVDTTAAAEAGDTEAAQSDSTIINETEYSDSTFKDETNYSDTTVISDSDATDSTMSDSLGAVETMASERGQTETVYEGTATNEFVSRTLDTEMFYQNDSVKPTFMGMTGIVILSLLVNPC